METRPPCPYCNTPFGQTPEFMMGCTNSECPEQPCIHDPVGQREIVDEYWKGVLDLAPHVKLLQRRKLEAAINTYQKQIEEFYND